MFRISGWWKGYWSKPWQNTSYFRRAISLICQRSTKHNWLCSRAGKVHIKICRWVFAVCKDTQKAKFRMEFWGWRSFSTAQEVSRWTSQTGVSSCWANIIPLCSYLSTQSALLVAEREGKQLPVYYICHGYRWCNYSDCLLLFPKLLINSLFPKLALLLIFPCVWLLHPLCIVVFSVGLSSPTSPWLHKFPL